MGWSSAVKASVAKTMQHAFCRPAFLRAQIDWERLVVIDFETYYDTDYTLRKLSTSEYIRDKRFKAHMMGIKVGSKKTKVIPHAKIKAELTKIDWSTHVLLSHNTAFDGFILSHHYGVIPKTYYDTLSMARGLHSNDIGASLGEVAQYYGVGNKIPNVLEQSQGIRDLKGQLYKDTAAYCEVDVDLCLDIFRKMEIDFPSNEMNLVDITIRMFCDPVLKVDIPRVRIEHARELQTKEDLLLSVIGDAKEITRIEKIFGKEKMLELAKKEMGSSEKFAQLLRNEGIEPARKISPAWIKKKPEERDEAKKYSYAFAKDDQFMQELLESDDDRVRELAECRISVKSTGNVTKAQRFINAGENDMALPVGLSYARAHTLRWGGNNKMNMQNLLRGGELRQSILAPAGYNVVVADSGQIECRVNGWLWGQDDLMEDFRNSDAGVGSDAYCNFATLVYGRQITRADKTERFVGKVCVLALGFSMGHAKLRSTLAKGALGGPRVFFDEQMCQKIVNAYRRKNHRIAAGWKICTRIIEDMAAGRQGSHKCLSWEKDKIWMPNGMALKYPGLKCELNEDTGWEEWTYFAKGKRTKIYGGLLCENIVQCLARIIVADQMLEIGVKRRVVTMTHDEVVAIARVTAAEKCFKEMMKAMTRAPSWCPDIPLAAEGGYAVNYSK